VVENFIAISKEIIIKLGILTLRSVENTKYSRHKEPVKSFVGMFRKMKISLYDN